MGATVPGPRYTGLFLPAGAVSSGAGFPTTGDWYVAGTRVGRVSSALLAVTGAITATTSIAATTSVSATTTMTAGTGLTVTTGHATVSAGNVVLGNPGAFATTQAVAAVKMGGSSLSGVAPVGAITTSAAIFASDTVVRKIIADGTASNVET